MCDGKMKRVLLGDFFFLKEGREIEIRKVGKSWSSHMKEVWSKEEIPFHPALVQLRLFGIPPSLPSVNLC